MCGNNAQNFTFSNRTINEPQIVKLLRDRVFIFVFKCE